MGMPWARVSWASDCRLSPHPLSLLKAGIGNEPKPMAREQTHANDVPSTAMTKRYKDLATATRAPSARGEQRETARGEPPTAPPQPASPK